MEKWQADAVVEALGGKAFQKEEGAWFVMFKRGDGRWVVLSDESVDEYQDREAFERGDCFATIGLI